MSAQTVNSAGFSQWAIVQLPMLGVAAVCTCWCALVLRLAWYSTKVALPTHIYGIRILFFQVVGDAAHSHRHASQPHHQHEQTEQREPSDSIDAQSVMITASILHGNANNNSSRTADNATVEDLFNESESNQRLRLILEREVLLNLNYSASQTSPSSSLSFSSPSARLTSLTTPSSSSSQPTQVTSSSQPQYPVVAPSSSEEDDDGGDAHELHPCICNGHTAPHQLTRSLVAQLNSQLVAQSAASQSVAQSHTHLIHLALRYLNERRRCVWVRPDMRIAQLRRRFFHRELAANLRVRLIYNGRELLDSLLLHHTAPLSSAAKHAASLTNANEAENEAGENELDDAIGSGGRRWRGGAMRRSRRNASLATYGVLHNSTIHCLVTPQQQSGIASSSTAAPSTASSSSCSTLHHQIAVNDSNSVRSTPSHHHAATETARHNYEEAEQSNERSQQAASANEGSVASSMRGAARQRRELLVCGVGLALFLALWYCRFSFPHFFNFISTLLLVLCSLLFYVATHNVLNRHFAPLQHTHTHAQLGQSNQPAVRSSISSSISGSPANQEAAQSGPDNLQFVNIASAAQHLSSDEFVAHLRASLLSVIPRRPPRDSTNHSANSTRSTF